MFKYLFAVCAVAAALAGCAGSSSGGSSAPATSTPKSDPVVLTVNGQPIHRSTIEALQKDLKFASQPDSEQAAENRAIDQVLINQEADRRFITLSPPEENAGLAQALAASGNVSAALKKAGISMAHFREEVNQRLLVRKLIAKQFADLHVSQAQLHERYAKDHKLFFIGEVVRLSVIQARNLLQGKEILKLLHQGRNFNDLANQYNPGAGGADTGWGHPAGARKIKDWANSANSTAIRAVICGAEADRPQAGPLRHICPGEERHRNHHELRPPPARLQPLAQRRAGACRYPAAMRSWL
jgi:hypothetical protein